MCLRAVPRKQNTVAKSFPSKGAKGCPCSFGTERQERGKPEKDLQDHLWALSRERGVVSILQPKSCRKPLKGEAGYDIIRFAIKIKAEVAWLRL